MRKKPTFNWEAEDKHHEFKTIRIEVNNVFKSYNTPQTEKIAIIKKWLGLQFLEILIHTEKERCNIVEGLFTHKTIKSNHYTMKPSNHYNFAS